MRFLIDVNIEKPIIQALITDGHDIKLVYEIDPTLEDLKIVELANKEKRVILTNDKDFGELVFNSKIDTTGVILFRLGNDKNTKIERLRQFLSEHTEEISKSFVVIKKNKITQSVIKWES